jgi:CelD/BcsL family acetyltransferase involved in cellulose biosynthesis
MGKALAEREALLDPFVGAMPEAGGVTQFRPAGSRIGAILPDSGGSLSLSVTTDLGAVEADWQALAERAAISPYQRYDLAAAWIRHAAAGEDLSPRIGVVRDETDRVVMILPFGVQRQFGIGIATYLGGSHFNLNLPLADPHLWLGEGAAWALLDAYAKAAGADLVLLRNQPERWKGVQHPFLCLPHYGAPDDVRLVVIDGDFDSYLLRQLSRKMRSELRRKTMKFRDAGIDGATRAATPEEVERYLTTFIEQKSKRLAAQGLDDPFTLPGVKEFLREASLHGLSGDGGVEIYAIVRDGHILSVRAGVRHGEHLSFMVQSFDTDEALAKYTPSEFLLTEVMLAGRTQGVTNFDFGVGDGRFKQVWSNDLVPMFNIAQGVTKTGQMLASLMQSKDAAKRYIKRHPRLFSAVQDARALSARLKSLPGLIFA